MNSSFSSQSFLGSAFFPPSQPSSQPTSSTPIAQNPNESILNSSTLSVLSQASNATSILSQSLIYKQQRQQVKKQTKYYGPGVSSKYGNPYLDRKRKERLERKKLKMMEERKEMARLSIRNASPSQTVGSSSYGQGNESYVSRFSNESFRSTTGFEDQDDLSTSVVNQSGKRSFGRVCTTVESSGDGIRGVMGPPGKKLKDGDGKATPSSSKTTKKVTPSAKFLMDVLDDKQPAPIPFNQQKATPSPSSSTPSAFGLSSAFAASTPSTEVASASVQSPVKFPFSTSTPKASPAPKEKGKEPIQETPIFTSTPKTFSFSSGFKSLPAHKEPPFPTTQASALSSSASQPTTQLPSIPQPTSQSFTAQLSTQGSSTAQAPTFGSFGKPAQPSTQPPKTESLQKPQSFSFTTGKPLVPPAQVPKSEASAKEEPAKAVTSKEEQPKNVKVPEFKETATGIDTQSIPRSLKDEVKKIPHSELPTRSFVFPNATSLSARIDSKIIEKIKASPASDLPVKNYKFPTVANFMKSGVKPFERSSSSEEITDKSKDEKVESSQNGLKLSTSVSSAAAATTSASSTATAAPSTFNWGASGFSLKKAGWDCPSCMVNNKEDSVKCISCETDKPGSKPATSTSTASGFLPPSSVNSASTVKAPTTTTTPSTFNWGASGFSMKKAGWECPSCMVNNKEDSVKCISCETDKPGATLSSTKSASTTASNPPPTASATEPAPSSKSSAPSTFNWGASGFSMKKAGWECPACMVNNKEDSIKCVSCETDKPGSEKAPSTFSSGFVPPSSISTAPSTTATTTMTAASTFNWGASGFSMKKAGWECPSCMVNNKEDSVKCVSCETDKPGTVSTTPAQSTSQSSTTGFTAPSFTFNAGGSKSSSSGFGGSAGAASGFSGFGSAGAGSNLFAAFGKQGSSEDKDKQAKESKKDSIDDSSKNEQLSTSETKPSPFSFTPGTSSSISSSAFTSSTPAPSSKSQTSGSVFGTSSAFTTPTDSKKDSKDTSKDNDTLQSNASGFGSSSFGSTSKPNTSGTGSGFGTTSVFGFGTGSGGTTNPAGSAGSATSSETSSAGNTGFAFGGVGSTSGASFGSFGSNSGNGNSSVFGSSGFSFGSAPASGSGFSFDDSKK
ncbi:hypothetical protein BKA69DRAFT_1100021 [Paraphysoderma sedebokerense]|nr:hypothetical protein BKA69DRAFT_1100021 [Paraphysoderma sedebokerense]